MRTLKSFGPLFYICVILPTLVAILYFSFFSSDIFISESRFVVRSPEKPAVSGLGALLKTAGFANAGDEIFAAQDFVISRDALKALNRDDAFFKAFRNPTISIPDRFNPVGLDSSFEALFSYYKNKVSIEFQSSSSITALKVRAFTARDAQRFNEQLLEMAEATVNRLNTRGREDLVRFAQREVDLSKDKARKAALALADYRDRHGVVDPERQAAVQLQMISKLQDELIASRTQLLQLKALAPQNPQVPILQVRIESLVHSIDSELGKVAGDRQSLAGATVEYQRRFLETQLADRQLASAMGSLEEAQNEARRKQAYVERIVQPNLPDEAMEPRRLRGVLATLVVGLIAWGVLSLLLAGIKEHQD